MLEIEVFTQDPPFKESYSSLSENVFIVTSPPLSHCHILRKDFYPNTTHTHLECKECFGACEALDLSQIKLIRLGSTIRRYCRIWEANEDKYLR